MNNKTIRNNLFSFLGLIIAFLTVRGFRFEITEKGFSYINTESFIWIFVFLLFFLAIQSSIREPDQKIKLISFLFGILIAFFYLAGITLEKKETLTWIWESRNNLVNCLNLFFSHTVLYYCFAFFIFRYLKNHSSHPGGRFSPKTVLLFWFLFLIIYIPWFLFCYPGVMTYDSGNQVKDALSVNTLGDFNPAFVTLLIRGILLPIKHITGSVQTGVGICSFLQMLIMTFVFSLTCERICHYLEQWYLRILIFLWYACYPVNNLYSVTLWKDILFSVCLLGFLLCIDSAAENEPDFFAGKKGCFCLFLTMVLLPLLRHNGISVTLVMSVYLIFRFRSFKRQVFLICGGALFLFAVWQFLLLPSIRTSTVPSGDVLSVPIQQIVCVLSKHHSEIRQEDLDELESYFNVPEIWTLYDRRLADPVKKQFNNDLYNSDPSHFFSLWRKFGKVYPADYLDAFLSNNYGYWFPETKYWISSYGVIIHGVIEDVHTAPIAKPGFVEKIYNWYTNQNYMKMPLLPLLFSRGACFWLWIFCGFYCLYNNRRKFLLFVPGFSLWFIILFSAVYNEYRYVYGLFICLPLFLAASFSVKKPEDRA